MCSVKQRRTQLCVNGITLGHWEGSNLTTYRIKTLESIVKKIGTVD